jgi:hypothetical protein
VEADERHLHLAHEQMHVVARIAYEGDALLVAGHVVASGAEKQLRRVVLRVQVGRSDRAGAVDALEVGLGSAEVADLRRVGAVADRRAIGGDVVCDELPEERPHRRRSRVRPGVVREVDAHVAWAAGPAQGVERRLVHLERREIVEQPPVAAAVDRRIDAFGRQTVIAGDANGVCAHAGISLEVVAMVRAAANASRLSAAKSR